LLSKQNSAYDGNKFTANYDANDTPSPSKHPVIFAILNIMKTTKEKKMAKKILHRPRFGSSSPSVV